MTDADLKIAEIKKDIFAAVMECGNANQQGNAVLFCEGIYQWCINHVAKVEVTPIVAAPVVRTTAKATRK